jgi:DNA-binding CsgD family transcriptional regulator
LLDSANFNHEQDELISALYEGPLQETPWSSFLPLLCYHLRAFAVSLVLRPPAAGDEGLILNYQRRGDGEDKPTSGLADPEDWQALAYKKQFFMLDLFVNLPLEQVVSLRELMPESQLLESEYYQHYLQPAGIAHILGADTREPDGLLARVRICRLQGEADFDNCDKALLEWLLPHMRRAIQLHANLNRMRSERNLYANAVNSFSVGTVILDTQARILDCNPVASAILDEKDGIKRMQDKLQLSQREDATRFKNMLQCLQENPDCDTAHIAQAMRVHRPSGRPDLGLVVRHVPTLQRSDNANGPAYAVFLSDPERQSDTSQEIIEQLFDLTRAEATLALLLARGLSINEASSELSVSPHTARTQLKAIFAKTGVSRQAELVRLIVKSVANLG